MSFEAGTKLGPYVVRSFIDAGGMGEVYGAFDPRLERQVAIKVLPAGLAAQPEFRRRFKRETQAISRLNHKNICTIYDTGTYLNRPYIVMELMEGQTLESLREGRPVDVERLLHIGIQVANALDAAHGAGIVHRDIKSANIFVNIRGDAKVLDFGIAKVANVGPGTGGGTEARITGENTPVGTVAFMSPEQAKGEEVDPRSDIFSLGVVLHEMATGLTPFRGTVTSIIGQLVSSDPIPRPRSLNPALPEALERVICRALEKDKRVRYQTAGDLLAAMRGVRRDLFLGSSAIPSFGPISNSGKLESPKRKRVAVPAFALTALVMTLGTVGVVKFWPWSSAIESIAVLPCSEEGIGQANSYFCQKVTRRLIGALKDASPELEVRSYPGVEHYGRDTRGIFLIGEELGVDAVARLAIREEEGALTLDVDVADVRTEGHVWGRSYPGASSEDETFLRLVASSFAENIQIRLSDADRERWDIEQTFDEANHQWGQRTQASLQTAVRLYREVIGADPSSAKAYAGLANSYILLHYYGTLPPDSAYSLAREAAETALDIDPIQAGAHAALGLVYRDHERDFERAQNELERAIQLDDQAVSSLQWYAEHLAITGQFARAEDFILRAERINPLDVSVRAVHGWISLCAGDFEEAEVRLQSALDMDPENPLANWFLGQLQFAEGDYSRAVETLERAALLNGDASRMKADLAGALAMAGNQARARDLLSQLTAGTAAGENISMYESAIVHAALGDLDRAFSQLEEALGEGTWQVANMPVDPMLSGLHDDPRFPGLLVRAGFGGSFPESE
jgi:serine/threonine protein kinase/Flp pilus assembly protein TadD